MKLSTIVLSLCATGAAATPPNKAHHNDERPASSSGSVLPWWQGIASLEPIPSALVAAGEAIRHSTVDAAVSATRQIRDQALEALSSLDRPKHPKTKLTTVYQTLQQLPGAGNFTKLLDDFPDLVDALNGTSDDGGEHTLFLPLDDAFDKIPDKFKHPSHEALGKFLHYHVVPGTKRAVDVLTSYTLESEAVERGLGGEHQRIRVGASLAGVTLNGYAKIKAVDIKATNGVIHVISDVLAPPPPLGPILTFFPAYFSTLLLAYEVTDFIKFVHGQHIAGSTFFAPNNDAFKSLGPKANAFLFNTKKGVKYLDAILKYTIAPNATVYSDAFYDKRTAAAAPPHQDHYTLETFLPGASLGVDIATVFGFRVINVNGFTGVKFHDAVGSNGVIHVVDKVILPPHNGKHVETADISVDNLTDILAPYVSLGPEDAAWEEL
ncbi:Fasciclin domain family protein [Cordyceps fumosorosea ARSEF 2679]|uniref:Fasciclin domain family protein n=1 Tax=Cordyceps fumosorosea (strain ARSEF 2679) TaxID=1081104 RepID=A0A168EH48_CORFA|nr:Fasciclin domain family protein [Cordyceps fumosorosea ARSEF 2679]OAA73797.1 Fasciclin domain family protein [Cordyceps fumosorosea ARSEF 2679]